MIRSAAETIRDRFPVSWIKLRTEELRLLQRGDNSDAASLAHEAYDFAGDLGLEHHCAALQRFM